MLAALLLVSSIASRGVLQLTHAQYGGEEIHVRPTGDYHFTSSASDMLIEVST